MNILENSKDNCQIKFNMLSYFNKKEGVIWIKYG